MIKFSIFFILTLKYFSLICGHTQTNTFLINNYSCSYSYKPRQTSLIIYYNIAIWYKVKSNKYYKKN